MVPKKDASTGDIRCPLCGDLACGNLGEHIRRVHGEQALRAAVLRAKEDGLPDAEIGARYGVSFGTLQEIVTEAYGANVSVLKRPGRIRRWEPPDFRPETTTVWSFRQRGNWATHNGRYRGNWSPYIPRNLILRYSRPGDVVLDYFVGGGTTAVEAKLLGRRCIARDINPGAVRITRENLAFSLPRRFFGGGASEVYEPEVSVGDARDLSGIPDGSVDLICAHPPYAGIIKYSTGISGDLSGLSIRDFLAQMGQVARESLRVLKPGGKCAVLIGDARRSRRVVPIGFWVVRVFLEAGFVLRELIIKRQHKCRATGFWYRRSIEYNFLLLAHEYLPVFEKPEAGHVPMQVRPGGRMLPCSASFEDVGPPTAGGVETTTVWLLPSGRFDEELRRNLVRRFARPNSRMARILFAGGDGAWSFDGHPALSMVYVSYPDDVTGEQAIADYRHTVRELARRAIRDFQDRGVFVVETGDVRVDGSLWPMGMAIYEDFLELEGISLREVVVVVPNGSPNPRPARSGELDIVHRYLLVYELDEAGR